MRHQERMAMQQLKLPPKKSCNPSHLKVPFRHFATQHENVQKRKGDILTELEAVKRLKSEIMTREKKNRLQRRSDLHVIQVGKGSMPGIQSKL